MSAIAGVGSGHFGFSLLVTRNRNKREQTGNESIFLISNYSTLSDKPNFETRRTDSIISDSCCN